MLLMSGAGGDPTSGLALYLTLRGVSFTRSSPHHIVIDVLCAGYYIQYLGMFGLSGVSTLTGWPFQFCSLFMSHVFSDKHLCKHF